MMMLGARVVNMLVVPDSLLRPVLKCDNVSLFLKPWGKNFMDSRRPSAIFEVEEGWRFQFDVTGISKGCWRAGLE